METYFGIAVFILLWVGQLIYSNGKQTKFNDGISDRISRIETDAKELRIWGEKQLADRSNYNRSNFLGIELFNECNKDLVRRLESIEEYKIDSRLATIETQLAHVLSILEELKRR